MGRSYPIVQYPYIEVVLNNGTELTTNMIDGKPDYFISLSHERAANLAGTCQMSISFVATGKVNPNQMEFEIANPMGYIRFRYGMSPEELSPMYIGRINNYTLSIREGVLTYSLSIVSRSVVSNFENISTDAKYKIRKRDTAEKVLEKMKKIIEETQLNKYYTFDVEGSDKNFKLSVDEVSPGSESPIAYLQNVAKSLVDKTKPKSYFYYIVVNDGTFDGNTKGKISLKCTKGSNKCAFAFEWGTRDTDVISWTPDYQGDYAIIQGSLENEKYKKYLEQNENGDYVGAKIPDPTVISSSGIYSFDDITSDSIKEVNDFVEKSRYAYTGKLTVLGLAGPKYNDLALIDTRVTINPMINGVAHHTGGEYMITGITDSLNAQGFTTTLTVSRPCETEHDDVVKKEE